MPRFRPGQRVRLRAWTDPDDPAVSSPEEVGLILDADDDVVTVELDLEYRDDDDPDGLREVPIDQVAAIID